MSKFIYLPAFGFFFWLLDNVNNNNEFQLKIHTSLFIATNSANPTNLRNQSSYVMNKMNLVTLKKVHWEYKQVKEWTGWWG